MTSEALVARLFGGILLAAGLLVVMLGGLCTGWIVVPATVQFWSQEGFRTVSDLWPVLVGGALTMTVGLLMVRAGLRRIRGSISGGSGPKQEE